MNRLFETPIDSNTEYLYRYNEIRCSNGVDEWDNPYPGYSLRIYLTKYEILKKTPKGCWVKDFPTKTDYFRQRRFILLTARKRFACPTLKEALESFIARKRKQIRIYEAKIKQANEGIVIACRMLDIERYE